MFVQQGDVQVFIPSSFSDGLTSYLSCGDAGYNAVLLCLLRDFISSLKCRDASCKGKKNKKTNRNKTRFLMKQKQLVELRTHAV